MAEEVGEIFCHIDPDKMKLQINPEVAEMLHPEMFHARVYGIGDVVDDNPAGQFKEWDK